MAVPKGSRYKGTVDQRRSPDLGVGAGSDNPPEMSCLQHRTCVHIGVNGLPAQIACQFGLRPKDILDIVCLLSLPH